MTHTISGTYATLVSLNMVADNPTTITSNGRLTDGLSVSYTGLAVVNAGSIGAGSNSFGIDFLTAGNVTNQSGGVISGHFGILGPNAALTVVNAGTVAASEYAGVALRAGGSVTNQSGGTISGADGISGYNAAVTVVNAGSVSGTGRGVYFLAGGSVTNLSGGAISGGNWGIYGYHDAVTVVNAGTIFGSRAAVKFAAGYANRLVIDPNAVFSGQVNGGNATGATQVSTLELASAGSAGTLSGLGTKYVDLAQVTVDAGAQWTLVGANTIAAGYTLTDVGTLTNAGTLSGTLTLAAGGVLSNASAGTVTASGGTAIDGTAAGAATIVNVGVIAGGSGGFTESGVYLHGGGTVTNQSGGVISGKLGIYGTDAATVTVVNAGSIVGSGTASTTTGLLLRGGGNVTNQSDGTISGYTAIVGSSLFSVTNAGLIAGSTDPGGVGVFLNDSSSVTNQSDGTISGGAGIVAYALATVVNAGTITGSSYAVKFAAGYANRLIADPGAVLAGKVQGGGGVLELASAASAGTLSGVGTSITNFSTLQFDAGATWTISGTDSASGLGNIAITGFANGDTIDLSGFVATNDTFANNVLTLTSDSSMHETLKIQGTFTSGSFQLSTDGNGGTDVVVCFCAGTRIGTPDGEVSVEQLQIGDLVLTAQHDPRVVTWIGHGKVLATRGRRSAATPVIVRRGALADNVPNRDLHVTKAHSLYIDDVLIPVEFLVNHRTILWEDRAQEVDIYHIELDSHDVLIANGAPAESYRDDGNRWLFHNVNTGWHLPPQEPYAPVLTGGPVVDAAWRRLLDRAGPSDLPPLTDDPNLHLVIDGERVDPEYRHGSLYGFRLPSSPKSVVIASRAGVPSELGIARDPRSLGVALLRVAVRQGAKFMLLDADDERLMVGFHAYEADCRLRWTDGRAELPAEVFARFDKGAEVMLHLGGATQYPDERVNPARAMAKGLHQVIEGVLLQRYS